MSPTNTPPTRLASALRCALAPVVLAGMLVGCGGGGGGGGAPPDPMNGTATLTWFPPTDHNDGSPLADLSGFRIYYARNADALQVESVDNPSAITWTIGGLARGNWFFVVTAYDSAGQESRYSDPVNKTIQ